MCNSRLYKIKCTCHKYRTIQNIYTSLHNSIIIHCNARTMLLTGKVGFSDSLGENLTDYLSGPEIQWVFANQMHHTPTMPSIPLQNDKKKLTQNTLQGWPSMNKFLLLACSFWTFLKGHYIRDTPVKASGPVKKVVRFHWLLLMECREQRITVFSP